MSISRRKKAVVSKFLDISSINVEETKLSVSLHWRKDPFGNPDHLLFIGSFNIGGILDLSFDNTAPERKWRIWIQTQRERPEERYEFLSEEDARQAVIKLVIMELSNVGG